MNNTLPPLEDTLHHYGITKKTIEEIKLLIALKALEDVLPKE